LIFGKRKDMPVNEETKSEQGFKPDTSFMSSLDNIEILREAPKKENISPRHYNQDLIGLMWAYSEAEKRVLSLR
jgi:hypothetical protein